MLTAKKSSTRGAIVYGLSAGLIVLILFNAGDADILDLMVPIWLVALSTYVIGRALAYVN